ncbi:hypothetical protein L1887_39108 [Cichorium endivia]|nr:hypothetical protein L1887_39108 [Cichorium endivia]
MARHVEYEETRSNRSLEYLANSQSYSELFQFSLMCLFFSCQLTRTSISIWKFVEALDLSGKQVISLGF